jgi:hypothetical protein
MDKLAIALLEAIRDERDRLRMLSRPEDRHMLDSLGRIAAGAHRMATEEN